MAPLPPTPLRQRSGWNNELGSWEDEIRWVFKERGKAALKLRDFSVVNFPEIADALGVVEDAELVRLLGANAALLKPPGDDPEGVRAERALRCAACAYFYIPPFDIMSGRLAAYEQEKEHGAGRKQAPQTVRARLTWARLVQVHIGNGYSARSLPPYEIDADIAHTGAEYSRSYAEAFIRLVHEVADEEPERSVGLPLHAGARRPVSEALSQDTASYIPTGEPNLADCVEIGLIGLNESAFLRLVEFAGQEPGLIAMLSGLINARLGFSFEEIEAGIENARSEWSPFPLPVGSEQAALAVWLLSAIPSRARQLWIALARFSMGAIELAVLESAQVEAFAIEDLTLLLNLNLLEEPLPEHYRVSGFLLGSDATGDFAWKYRQHNPSSAAEVMEEELANAFLVRIRGISDAVVLDALGDSKTRRIQSGYAAGETATMDVDAAWQWLNTEELNIQAIMDLSPGNIRDQILMCWLRVLIVREATTPEQLVRKLAQEQSGFETYYQLFATEPSSLTPNAAMKEEN